MFAMFGLGAQEILILLCCGTGPFAVAGIAFVLGRRSRKTTHDDYDDDPDA